MGIFTKKTPEQFAADKAEKERKRIENLEQKKIYRDAFNKARREQLAIEGQKKGALSAQKQGGSLLQSLGNIGKSLSAGGAGGSVRDQLANIGAGANNYIMDGLPGNEPAPKRRKRN